jgi:hypothetical protein
MDGKPSGVIPGEVVAKRADGYSLLVSNNALIRRF